MKKKNPIICAVLAALLILPLVLIQPVTAETNYESISAIEAKQMIDDTPTLLILDVRNDSEYELGHLYNAILLPLYQIQSWNWNTSSPSGQPIINFLQAHINDTVLVYCKGGSRSTLACEILIGHGFQNIFNMNGGISEWMQEGYPIYTRYHHVNMNIADEEISVTIEPLLLYQLGCTSCQNRTCNNGDTPQNVTITTLEQNGTTTVVLGRYEINGTEVSYTATMTILDRISYLDGGSNITAALISNLIERGEQSIQVLSIKYLAQYQNYNVTVLTTLIPSGTGTYNSSSTLIGYTPMGKVPIKTQDTIDTNVTLSTLSHYYKGLNKAIKELADLYESSEDPSLQNLADSYNALHDDISELSKLVKNDWRQYDLTINGPSRAVAGIGLHVPDPDAILNGGFESGSSYWTLYGSGVHMIVSDPYPIYDGNYELMVGSNLAVNSWDSSYQAFGLPADAVNVRLKLHYHFWTEDLSGWDRFEVYVAKYGQNPQCVFSVGGSNGRGQTQIIQGDLDINLDDMAGYSAYIYMGVWNGGDSNYYTLCFVDDVAIEYEERSCDFGCFLACAGNYQDVLTYCGQMYMICDWAPDPFNPFCLALLACSIYMVPDCVSWCCWGY